MRIHVNSEPVEFLSTIDYAYACRLARLNPERIYSAVVHYPANTPHRDRTLTPNGEPALVVDGMRITIADTSGA